MHQALTYVKGAALGAAAALVANLAIFLVGNAGAPLQVVTPGDTVASDLPIGAVIAASIVPLLLGTAVLWGLQKWRPNGATIWMWTAATLGVVSIASPASLDVDTGSKIALSIMHVATAVAAVVGHRVVGALEPVPTP